MIGLRKDKRGLAFNKAAGGNAAMLQAAGGVQ